MLGACSECDFRSHLNRCGLDSVSMCIVSVEFAAASVVHKKDSKTKKSYRDACARAVISPTIRGALIFQFVYVCVCAALQTAPVASRMALV